MPSSQDGRGRRAYLHIGLPKTGTTFLQAVLWANRDELRRNGVLYPAPYREAMFHAAVELRGTHRMWGLEEKRVAGTWQQLSQTMQGFDGSSIFSHEILSGAKREQIGRVFRDLDGLDVHLVVTVRDPSRQISAAWQEGVKNGGTSTFGKFLDRVRNDIEEGKRSSPFWRAQDLQGVLGRWTRHLPPEKVHLVVAPRFGSDPSVLWRRFAEAVGLDPDICSIEIDQPSNQSLDSAQSALLRDVNAALDGRIVRPPYTYVVKRYFAQRVLTQHRSARLTLPDDMVGPVRSLAEDWTRELTSAGYVIHGDLADLLPVPTPADAQVPVDVPYEDRYAAATAAIAELLVEICELREARGTTVLQHLTSAPLARRVIDRVRRSGARSSADGG